MNKLRKYLCSFAVATMLLSSMIGCVNALEYQTKDWYVKFENDKMTQNFTENDIIEMTNELQPQDELTLDITLYNEEDAVDWYMSNDVLRTFEEDYETAQGAAYTYKLTYVNNNDESRVLYDSENVGGDDTQGGQGLHQATSTLKDYFYLDSFEKNQSGHIILHIVVDGETSNNDYQNTMARLKLNFAVEKRTTNTVVYQPGSNTSQKTLTGDQTNILMYVLMTICSLIALVCLICLYVKTRKKEEKQ